MENELSTEEWKQKKKEQRAIFTARQRLPYEVKLKRQAIKAWQFYEEILSRDMNVHVSVGGLDSITLYIWLCSIGIEPHPYLIQWFKDHGYEVEETPEKASKEAVEKAERPAKEKNTSK